VTAVPDPLYIVVHGDPAPQGSKRAFAVRGKGGVPTGKIAVIESSHDRVKSWRQDVKEAAEKAIGGREMPVFTGPVLVSMVFSLARPKSHYGTGRNATALKASAPHYPVTAKDVSKEARSTEDALTAAGAWKDDQLVVAYELLAKCYAGPQERQGTWTMATLMPAVLTLGCDVMPVPGCVIRIWPLL
jgi:crossover junction endodeoxyribonuclease RusA